MKRLALVFVLVFAATLAVAQQPTPVFDIFGGFSLNRTSMGPENRTAPGFDVSVGYNPFRMLRLTGSIAGQYHGTDISLFDQEVKANNYQLLFGPELVFRNESKVTPFVRGMFGWATRRYTYPTGRLDCTGFSCTEERTTLLSDSGLALAAGGGVDVAVWDSLHLRVAQFDFLRTRMGRQDSEYDIDPADFPTLTRWQSHYRFATGVVLRWGEKE